MRTIALAELAESRLAGERRERNTHQKHWGGRRELNPPLNVHAGQRMTPKTMKSDASRANRAQIERAQFGAPSCRFGSLQSLLGSSEGCGCLTLFCSCRVQTFCNLVETRFRAIPAQLIQILKKRHIRPQRCEPAEQVCACPSDAVPSEERKPSGILRRAMVSAEGPWSGYGPTHLLFLGLPSSLQPGL